MKCKRCNNENPKYFYQGSKGMYCRLCIGYSRLLIDDDLNIIDYPQTTDDVDYHINYQLSQFQKEASKKLLSMIDSQSVLLHCVCGAGKTEIVLDTIKHYLNQNKKVCYAISRMQVVIELQRRFSQIFNTLKVVGVYGGHHDEIYGDLIVCTTHQLYRYYQCFDLLIIDEPDAFPFKGNDVLWSIAHNACIGHVIYSTATLDDRLSSLKDDVGYVQLNRRPHGYDLPVPKMVIAPTMYLYYCLYQFLKQNQPCIVFLPTIKQTKFYYQIYRHFFSCHYVSSVDEQKDLKIEKFRNNGYQVMFSTSILERGVTIDNVKVVIVDPQHMVNDVSSMIQMLGRVGRSFKNPQGNCLILSNCYSDKARMVKDAIERANHSL